MKQINLFDRKQQGKPLLHPILLIFKRSKENIKQINCKKALSSMECEFLVEENKLNN
jgi:hypothetical protein